MPGYGDCMCGVCLTSSPANEDGIAASRAPVPTEPEAFDPPREGWWTWAVTAPEPDPEGRAGGIGPRPEVPGPPTRKERRAAAR